MKITSFFAAVFLALTAGVTTAAACERGYTLYFEGNPQTLGTIILKEGGQLRPVPATRVGERVSGLHAVVIPAADVAKIKAGTVQVMGNMQYPAGQKIGGIVRTKFRQQTPVGADIQKQIASMGWCDNKELYADFF